MIIGSNVDSTLHGYLIFSSPGYFQFYAPWCGYCKKLEPVWHDVGVELKTSGSPVRVGKMDATAYSGE